MFVPCAGILCCAFGGSSGEYLCLGSADKSVSLYRRRKAVKSWLEPNAVDKVVRLLGVHKEGVTCCSFRKAGRLWRKRSDAAATSSPTESEPDVWLCLGSWDRTATVIKSVKGLFDELIERAADHSSSPEPCADVDCVANEEDVVTAHGPSDDGNACTVHTWDMDAAWCGVAGQQSHASESDACVTPAAHLQLHDDGILCSSASPEGSMLCLGSSDKTASLWNMENVIDDAAGTKCKHKGLVHHLKNVSSSRVLCCTFARDGRTLCLGAENSVAVLVNVRNGQVVLRLDQLHTGPINCCSFSHDFLYVIGLPRHLQHTLCLYSRCNAPAAALCASSVVTFVQKGSDVDCRCLGSADGKASMLDESTGRRLRLLEGIHDCSIQCCGFSSGAELLCLGAADGCASLMSAADINVARTLDAHWHPIRGCCFSKDSDILVMASLDCTASVWRIDSNASSKLACAQSPERILNKEKYVHKEYIRCCAISPDGSFLVLGSGDTKASMWKLEKGSHDPTFVLEDTTHEARVGCCCFGPDSKVLCLGLGDNTATLWQEKSDDPASTWMKMCDIEVHNGPIRCCAFMPSTCGSQLETEEPHACSCAESCGHSWLCLGSQDKTASLTPWEAILEDSSKLRTHGSSPRREGTPHFSQGPTGTFAVELHAQSTSMHKHARALGKTRAVDMAKAGDVMRFRQESAVCCCSFHPGGKLLVLGSEDKKASVIDMALVPAAANEDSDGVLATTKDPRVIEVIACRTKVLCCTFSPVLDDNVLCLGLADGTVVLYQYTASKVATEASLRDWSNWKTKRIEGMHSEGVSCCAISPDGRWLCLGSNDSLGTLIDLTCSRHLVEDASEEWPRWVTVPSVHSIVRKSQANEDGKHQRDDIVCDVRRAVKHFPEMMWSDQGELLHRCVDARNTQAVLLIVDAALKDPSPPNVSLRPYSVKPETQKMSPLRRAAQQNDRDMISGILRLHGAAIESKDSYFYTIHKESAPDLHSDLVYICTNCRGSQQAVVEFLEKYDTVTTPFKVGAVRMDPEVHTVAHAFDKDKDYNISVKAMFSSQDRNTRDMVPVVDSGIPAALCPTFFKSGRWRFTPPALLQVRCAKSNIILFVLNTSL